MFLDNLLIFDVRIFIVTTKVCVIHVNPREEYTIVDYGYYVSCYNTKVYTLVEGMATRFNNLHIFWMFILMVCKDRKIS